MDINSIKQDIKNRGMNYGQSKFILGVIDDYMNDRQYPEFSQTFYPSHNDRSKYKSEFMECVQYIRSLGIDWKIVKKD